MGQLCPGYSIDHTPKKPVNGSNNQECSKIFSDIKAYFKFQKVLGTGHFGTVRKAVSRTQANFKVAIKTIDKNKIKNHELLQQEFEIMCKMDHPNIIKLFGKFEDEKYYHMIMEYCKGGDLLDRILDKGNYDESDAAFLMKKILRAVNHIHANGVCHRDLKPENFMFDSKSDDAELKLIDFGLSNKFGCKFDTKIMKSCVGTPNYIAPEVLRGSYGLECDIWSCGVILYVLLCGAFPFFGSSKNELFGKILNTEVNFEDKRWRRVSDSAKSLIQSMLKKEPSNRINAIDALKHPWFKVAKANENPLNPKILNSLRNFKVKSRFQKEALTVLVKYLNYSQIKELKDTFISLDTEKDGFLNFQDIEEGLRLAGFNHEYKVINSIISNLNPEGKINYSEFILATLESKCIIEEENIWNAFNHFAQKSEGRITAESLGAVLRTSGRDNLNARELIQEVDKDHDGCLSFEDFRSIIYGN